jgi:Phosphotransferase enzyme family
VRAISEPGGFSPGVAARLHLADGRRAFAKVVSQAANPESPGMHRIEGAVLARLPATLPVPRLLATYDTGEWVGLILEEIDGRPPRLPWRRSELDRVLAAIGDLQAALTPAPFAAPTFAERHRNVFGKWGVLARALAQGSDPLADVDPWAVAHLSELVALEQGALAATAGPTLLHSDLRADNLLIAKDRVYVADWPAACVGAGWVDLALFLPSVAMQGGPEPWTLFDASPLTRAAPAERVDAFLAGLAGFWLEACRRPAPPGLSTLRPFQRVQGEHTLRWLRRRWSRRPELSRAGGGRRGGAGRAARRAIGRSSPRRRGSGC